MTEEVLGRDLRIERGLFGFGLATDLGDLETAVGVDNLVQALLIRFNTPIGDLAALGHPDYGTRLHDLIGRRNTETTRNLVRLYTLETLRAEPRVSEVHHLGVEAVPGRPDLVEVSIILSGLESQTPVNLVFNVRLEGAP